MVIFTAPSKVQGLPGKLTQVEPHQNWSPKMDRFHQGSHYWAPYGDGSKPAISWQGTQGRVLTFDSQLYPKTSSHSGLKAYVSLLQSTALVTRTLQRRDRPLDPIFRFRGENWCERVRNWVPAELVLQTTGDFHQLKWEVHQWDWGKPAIYG